MKLYIRGRAPFEAESYEFDEDTGLLYATGQFKEIHGQPMEIAVPVSAIDYFDLTDYETVDATAVEGLSDERLADIKLFGGSE